MPSDEKLLRELHAAQLISFGTTAPFALGPVAVQRIGYARTPICFCTVACKEQDGRALVPVARQHVYRRLEAAGVPNGVLEYVPGVGCEKERSVFEDMNPSSNSCGKRKVGSLYQFRFDIKREGLHYFEFEWHGAGRVKEGVG